MRNRNGLGIASRFGAINGAGGVAYRHREGFARVIIISLSLSKTVCWGSLGGKQGDDSENEK